MEEAIVVKYRNGYPTKKSINALIKSYLGERDAWKLYLERYLSPHTLYWNKKEINEKIEDFCLTLKQYGIEVESVQQWVYPRTGFLKIKQKI